MIEFIKCGSLYFGPSFHMFCFPSPITLCSLPLSQPVCVYATTER